jgi:nucleoside-diphosphate-sugar epimerase
VKYKYVYFSTYATCLDNLVNSNTYVRSKYLAEQYLKKNTSSYKIIRLIFPFGKEEHKNRLLSRIIGKIKSGEKISVDRLTLNLTPISDIQNNFWRLLESPLKEINLSNGIEIFFPDLVEFLYKACSKVSNFNITDKELKIVSNSSFAGSTRDDIYKEIALMTNE